LSKRSCQRRRNAARLSRTGTAPRQQAQALERRVSERCLGIELRSVSISSSNSSMRTGVSCPIGNRSTIELRTANCRAVELSMAAVAGARQRVAQRGHAQTLPGSSATRR
jgi:hypothetical protein